MSAESESAQQPLRDADEIRGWQSSRWISLAEKLLANPFFAYGLVLLILLRELWGVWRYLDVTTGDTSSYFLDALMWTHGLHDDIVWSPLYTDFFGTVVALIHNVADAVLVHRLIIVIAGAVLVLAAMRSLLGPTLGFIAGLWWVLIPANVKIEYEIHLFAMLPVLGAVIVLGRWNTPLARGAAVALLLVAAALVRQEYVIALAFLATAVVISEGAKRRKSTTQATAYLRAYGVPLFVALLLIGGAYWRSVYQGQAAWSIFNAKEELNMCQVYAYSYQQRHPTRFTGSPWTDCGPLMQKTFGKPLPTFIQATSANPGAVVSFVGWNAQLLPAGLQVSLFGATSTANNPGYFPVKTGRRWALLLTIAALLVVVAGMVCFWRDFAYWRRSWLAPKRWPILLVVSLGATAVVVALTQRPRAEYIYGLTIGLMALIVMCAAAVVHRIGWTRAVAPVALVASLLIVIAVPRFYSSGPRPLHDALERLQSVRGVIEKPGATLITSGYNSEICAYMARRSNEYCMSLPRSEVDAKLTQHRTLPAVLAALHANVIYADSGTQADPLWQSLLRTPGFYGWRQVTAGTAADGRWSVLVTTATEAPARRHRRF